MLVNTFYCPKDKKNRWKCSDTILEKKGSREEVCRYWKKKIGCTFNRTKMKEGD